ncbi:hypothetical protein DERF_012411 [Dermatophagoides farinae]|uniref:Uncharacterized protein n=1 Tax=Dermatophagoides farinae TaxID=6954 RepID=A0A922HPI8_DERFA|nr:hypothetical protein DERF_012411 [Dermatophagoides farinae]
MFIIFRFNYWSFMSTMFIINCWLLYLFILYCQSDIYVFLATKNKYDRKYLYQSIECYVFMVSIIATSSMIMIIVEIIVLWYYRYQIGRYFPAYQFTCLFGRIIRMIFKCIFIKLF